ncbi:MAG: peptidase M3 [Planctomycetes bacterium]|nr:peptidase M3 [Planctomycetota bacterium]
MKQLCGVVVALAGCVLAGCANQKELALDRFIDEHVEQVRPFNTRAALVYWDAAVTGEAEKYDLYSELNLKIRKIYSDPNAFARLKSLRESGHVKDPVLSRQLDQLYNAFLSNQIAPDLLAKIVKQSTNIEKNFSTFRATVDGSKITDNQIKAILKTDTDSGKRQKAWLASKQVGEIVAEDLITLVKLRNEAAQKLGFENFHVMSLATSEQSVDEIDQIFGELYELTKAPFANLKAELDGKLSEQLGVPVDQLRPWHYHDPFFQETPMVYELNLDVYYEGKDIAALSKTFYDGIGLDVQPILDHSDLYEKEGKNPHAFCTDIDRAGDVRILCNIKDNETWMETQLHELGHAVYDSYQSDSVPYLLREPAHIFTTEAVAMFFGRLSRNPAWMQQMLHLTGDQKAEIETVAGKYAQLKQLIFARWAMVMYNFEKALYADPDQDLNTVWWDTVEKYQLVKRPEGRDKPDWAAKIHFAIAPCYYHNYMLGELLASQLHHKIVFDVLGLESDKDVSYVSRPEVGTFFKDTVFGPGAVYPWNEMIKRATGEPLTARYFVEQFVN